jgi:hypothetical protein
MIVRHYISNLALIATHYLTLYFLIRSITLFVREGAVILHHDVEVIRE